MEPIGIPVVCFSDETFLLSEPRGNTCIVLFATENRTLVVFFPSCSLVR